MRSMYIAIILPTIISKNGTAKQSLELALQLRKKGHKVSFYTFAYLAPTTFPEFKSFSIHYCRNIEKSLLYKYFTNVATLEKIYLHLGFLFFFEFCNILKKEKIDVLNPHEWFGIWVAGFVKKANALIAHINDVPERENKGLIERIKLLIDRNNSHKIDQVIVLDQKNQQKVVSWLGIKKDKVKIVRSGIDIEKYKNFSTRFSLRKELHIPNISPILLSANLLAENRRYEDVLEALTLLKKKNLFPYYVILSKLDFASNYAKKLQEIIEEKNLSSQVLFIDKFFSDTERMDYIKNADILLFPNSPQTWGLTVLEAMGLGIPVIVSKGSGVSEVLHDNKDALLFNSGDSSQLSKKISMLLTNKNLKRNIAKEGKKYILATFSWIRYASEIESVMQTVLKK